VHRLKLCLVHTLELTCGAGGLEGMQQFCFHFHFLPVGGSCLCMCVDTGCCNCLAQTEWELIRKLDPTFTVTETDNGSKTEVLHSEPLNSQVIAKECVSNALCCSLHAGSFN